MTHDLDAADADTQHLERSAVALFDELPGRSALAAYRIAPDRAQARSLTARRQDDQDEEPDAASSGGRVAVRPEDVFPAASLAKIPVAVEVFRRISIGQFAPDERFDTSAEPRVGGGGLLDYFNPASELTLRELVLLMLAVSDNTAANFLLDLVGMGEVNETMSRMHFERTRMARRFMDMQARAARRDNVTTANDMAELLLHIYHGTVAGARDLRELLAVQHLGEDIQHWLPESATLAHKTGTLEGIFHNAGIISGPHGNCAYCVLTAEQEDMPAARYAVGRVVRLLWDAWCA